MSSKAPLEQVDFVTLWSHHARRVHAYILTLVHNVADADDLLQETGVTLWEKYHAFEPGSDFGAWAARTAYLHVCNWHRKRRPLQPLDETLFDLLTTETAQMSDLLEARFDALARCVRLLGTEERKLLDASYHGSGSVNEIAAACNRSRSQYYRELREIHRRLLDCIQRRVEGRTGDGR